MSAALISHPDASTHSAGTVPDLSLGSLGSEFSTPARTGFRIPSATSETTAPSSAPISTPSPPAVGPVFSRKNTPSLAQRLNLSGGEDGEDGDGGGDLLDTPGMEKRRWGDTLDTPVATRPKRVMRGGSSSGSKGVTLTLRDQEKVSSYRPFTFISLTRSSSTSTA